MRMEVQARMILAQIACAVAVHACTAVLARGLLCMLESSRDKRAVPMRPMQPKRLPSMPLSGAYMLTMHVILVMSTISKLHCLLALL